MTLFVKTDSIGFDGGKPKNYNSIESLVVPSAEVDTNMQQPKKTRRSYVLLASIGFVFAALLSLNFQRSSPSMIVELFKASSSTYQPSENCPPRSISPKKRGGSGRSVIPNDVGAGSFISPFTAADLFKGYKVTTDQPLMGRLFELSPQHLLLEGLNFGYTNCKIIESVSDLNTLLNIDGELTVSYGAVSGIGSGYYLGKSVSSSKKKSITYVDRQVIYQIRAKNEGLVMTEDFSKSVVDDDLIKIYEKFGTKMVSAIQFGCSLYARFEIISNNDEDLEDFAAQVQGQVGFGKMSGDVRAKFEKKDENGNSDFSINVFVTSLGVALDSFSGTGPDAFDQAQTLISEYNRLKNELLETHENIIGISDLNDIDPSDRCVPIAAEIDGLMNYVKNVDFDSNIATFIEKQAENTGKVLQETYLLYDRIENAKVAMNLKTDKNPYLHHYYYRPFSSAVDDIKLELNNKLSECSQYLGKKVGEVYCEGIEAPRPLADEYIFIIQELLGNGIIYNPWGLSKEMYYDGIVVEINGVKKPIYEGYVKCLSNSYDPFGRQEIRTLKEMLKNNPDPKC
jgi:hypothetical protein